jgi:hypothetical protein
MSIAAAWLGSGADLVAGAGDGARDGVSGGWWDAGARVGGADLVVGSGDGAQLAAGVLGGARDGMFGGWWDAGARWGGADLVAGAGDRARVGASSGRVAFDRARVGVGLDAELLRGARDGVRQGRGTCGARGAGGGGVVVGLEWRADGKRIL